VSFYLVASVCLIAPIVVAAGGGKQKRLDTWRAMEQIYSSGKCKAIGTSNFCEQHLQDILNDAAFTVKPMVNQMEFHPQCQWRELRQFCTENSIANMGYMPLGSANLLSNKTIKSVAQSSGRTPAQVCDSQSAM
jgi:diketogulonate reductase-like aldo/keto reductase